MAFTATLHAAVSNSPGTVDLDVTYADDASGYSIRKPLNISINPALTAAQQRSAVQAAVIADAQLYKTANAVAAQLTQLIGMSITIP